MSSVDQGLQEATVGIDVTPLVDDGLGNSAYLVDLGEGRGLVVDASRDLRAVRAAAERQGLTLAYAGPTPTCTPTSSPEPSSWPPTTAPR